jgi:hypothetical protein
MQLKCKECNHTFEDNETATQYNILTAAESDDSYTGDPCCPYCGSVELKSADDCKIRKILEHIPTPEEIKQSRRCIAFAQNTRRNN